MRILKQLLYGVCFLAVIGGLIGGGYYLFFRAAPSCTDGLKNQNEEAVDCGGSCISCALKNAKPITDKEITVETFDNGNETITVLAEIANPNLTVGIPRLDYQVIVRDKNGKELFSKTRQSFIYPGKRRTIVEAAIPIAAQLADEVKIMILPVAWQPADVFKNIPEEKMRVEKASLTLQGSKAVVNGTLINDNPIALNRVLIKAILSDKEGNRQNASFTLQESIKAFGQADIAVHIPLTPTQKEKIDPMSTKFLIEVVRQ